MPGWLEVGIARVKRDTNAESFVLSVKMFLLQKKKRNSFSHNSILDAAVVGAGSSQLF
jgi:hypothetical protein